MSTDTATSMIAEIRHASAALKAAQTRVFVLATEWADARLDPEQPSKGREVCVHGCRQAGRGDVEVGDFNGGCAEGCVADVDGLDDPFIPAVQWSAPAAFGAAIGRTSQAASLMIRDALITRHRLPCLWARVVDGEVEPHKARMIAQSVIGRPRDVSDHLDQELAPIAHKIGPVVVARRVDDAMLRLYPEQRELEQLEALDRRFVRLDESSINHVGIADMAIRADWKDLFDFDVTVARVATAIAARDAALGLPPQPVDVRRARAIGILADPARLPHCWRANTHRRPPSVPSSSSPSRRTTCSAWTRWRSTPPPTSPCSTRPSATGAVAPTPTCRCCPSSTCPATTSPGPTRSRAPRDSGLT